jgi:triacylglycerol lipase
MIGISQGGIIARYQIAKVADNKVRKCITLCSPHHGSWLAYLAPLPGIKDLRPNSRLLQELDNAKAQYHAVYNPLDLMVFPGWSAKLEAAQENKRIYSPLHQLTFKKKETFNHILSILNS